MCPGCGESLQTTKDLKFGYCQACRDIACGGLAPLAKPREKKDRKTCNLTGASGAEFNTGMLY